MFVKMVWQVNCEVCHMWESMEGALSPGDFVCRKCLEIRELQLRVAELESQVETLCSTRDGANFLDSFILELDTPLSPKEEECSSDGHDWVTVRRAGKHSQKRGAEESQTLALFDRYEISATCVDKEICEEDGQTDPSTPVQEVKNVILIGDETVGRTDTVFCSRSRKIRKLCCLPGARVKDVTAGLEINLRHEGEDPIVMVHIGTNDIGRTSRDELRSAFRELGIKLRNRTSKVMISGLLPEPGANWYRQKKIIDLNAWLKEWCGEQEFQFMGHWHEYWGRWELFQRNGLHLNSAGTNVLATRINREVERALNY
uniref:SGNH hydrolase-type esterase domain-containing protein n=1 Tax=Callorhinchus milii TaxID=7868 RepID=A0A4W3JQX2_CALMI